MAENKKSGKKWGFKKWLCLVGYLLVPIFFVILYFLMTETYEDVIQATLGATSSVGEILRSNYEFLPRLGEFYQKVAMHFMTPQLSFGLDMMFRLGTALAASGVVWLVAVFATGRKLKLQYKDVAIYLGVMILIMTSIFSDAFMARFSDTNNYVFALLVSVGFALLFRLGVNGKKWWQMLGGFALGFLVGMCSEVIPVCALALVVIFVVVKFWKRELHWKEIWQKYRVQICAILGIFGGLIFFYMGGGVSDRINSQYSQGWDYISILGIFQAPIYTIATMVSHVWFNMRYLFFAVPLMLMYILLEATVLKKKGAKNTYLSWQVILFGFATLFMGASSIVAVPDHTYHRYFVPVFMTVVMATGLFVYHVLDYAQIMEKTVKIATVVLVGLNVILVIDMTYAFTKYNTQMASKLDTIQRIPGEDVIFGPVEDYYMSPSPIFKLKQLPPFDWGPSTDYLKFGSGKYGR